MSGVDLKIYSVFFKLLLRHRLQSLAAAAAGEGGDADAFGVSCRADEATAPANPAFSAADGVASKDLHVDPNSALFVRIFLPTPLPHLLRPRCASEPAAGTADAFYRGYLPHVVSSPRAAASARRRLPIVVQWTRWGVRDREQQLRGQRRFLQDCCCPSAPARARRAGTGTVTCRAVSGPPDQPTGWHGTARYLDRARARPGRLTGPMPGCPFGHV